MTDSILPGFFIVETEISPTRELTKGLLICIILVVVALQGKVCEGVLVLKQVYVCPVLRLKKLEGNVISITADVFDTVFRPFTMVNW